MKRVFFPALALLLFTTAAAAGSRYDGPSYYMEWRTDRTGYIINSSVCYNYQGTPDHQPCRRQAFHYFKERCNNSVRSGRKNEFYCRAARTFTVR